MIELCAWVQSVQAHELMLVDALHLQNAQSYLAVAMQDFDAVNPTFFLKLSRSVASPLGYLSDKFLNTALPNLKSLRVFSYVEPISVEYLKMVDQGWSYKQSLVQNQ